MTTKCNVLLAAGLLAAAVLTGTAWAHGNVVPQAVETKGLTSIKDAGVAVNEDFLAANVDPQARAEQLAIDDWSRLTLAINARRTLINDTATQ